MNWEILLQAAQQAREHAYAPYSHYPVGAALLDEHERVWTGCNVENVSYGLCLCGERTAIVKMVSAGARRWSALVVVTRDGGTPCGACLQVLSEFAQPDSQVLVCSEAGERQHFAFQDLMPHGFRSDQV